MSKTLKMNERQKDSAAQLLAAKVLGTRIKLKLISRGPYNNVYLVTKNDNEKYTLRLGHPAFIKAYRQASEAMAAARKAGLPVPEIVLCGDSLIERSYLITPYVDGISGDKFSGDKLEVWHNIGELAERINRISTVGYGQHLFKKEKGEETWRRYIIPNIDAQLGFYSSWKGFGRTSRKPFFTKTELLSLAAAMEPLKSLRLTPRLIHVDLAPRNVLVNTNGGITCIIDWDSAKSFPQPHQVAVSTFWLSPEEKQAFMRGYGRNFDPKIIKAFQVFEYLTQIPYYYKQPELAKTARSILLYLLEHQQLDTSARRQLLQRRPLAQEI